MSAFIDRCRVRARLHCYTYTHSPIHPPTHTSHPPIHTSHQSLWLKIGATVQKEFGVNILMHLTCHLPKVRTLSRFPTRGRALLPGLTVCPPFFQQ